MPTAPAAKRQRPSQEAPPATVSNNSLSRMLNQVALAYDHGEKFFPLSFTPGPLLKAMGITVDEFFEFPIDDSTGEHWVSARRKQIFKHLFALMDALDSGGQHADEALKEEGLVLSKLFIAGFIVFLGSSGWGALIDDDLLVCSVACQYYSDRKVSLPQAAGLFHQLGDCLADIYVSSLNYLTQCITCVLKKIHVLNMKNVSAAPLLKGESNRTALGGLQSQEQHVLTARMTQLLALVVQRIACWPSPLLHSRFSLLTFRDPYGIKKHWRELKPTEYRLQARIAAEVRQTVGWATPLTWLSLVHLVAYSDVSSFKMFQRGISIASKPPLTEPPGPGRNVPDPEAPFPPLDRLAIRTRTKYKFTFPTASAIRESFCWWNILTSATRLFCQNAWKSDLTWSQAFQPAANDGNCCSVIKKIWQRSIVQGQLDSNFALRHILRVVAACTRDRRDNVYLTDKVLEGETLAKPVTSGSINLHAAALLTLAIDFFGRTAVRREFLRLLSWNRDLMLTKLAYETNALAGLVEGEEPPSATEGLVIDDPVVSLIQKKSITPFPISRPSGGDSPTNSSIKLSSQVFTPDCIASASGIGICAAIFTELGLVEFDTVWALLPPDDYVLKLVARIHRLSLEDSKSKASYIEQVEQCDFDRIPELWFKTQLVRYFSDIQKRDSMDVLMHCICPRLELLAAAVELNLKEVSVKVIERFEEVQFPYYLSRIIRKAFGTLLGSTSDITNSAAVLGWSRGTQWVLRRSDARNGVLECYRVMRGWILGNAEVVSIVCEELKKRTAEVEAEEGSGGSSAAEQWSEVEDLMVNGVMTALLLLPTPSEIPAAPTSNSQPMAHARSGDTVSHQVSDIIWETIQDWSLERRYRMYARFYLEKMNELEIRYLCKQDRSRVNKSLKKITASSARAWDKADKGISNAICRSSMNNPFETFGCIIHTAELFDPMWLLTALDYLRVLTRLACDILLFMLVERQQALGTESGRDNGGSGGVPKRVRNLSLLAARYLRKYPWVSTKPLIMSICGGVFEASQRTDGSVLPEAYDHLYLCDLLTWLGGCNQTGMMEISPVQLNCYFGGPALRALGLGDESVRLEELKPGARLCKNNLRDVLLESNVFRALVYGLGKMNINVTFNSQRNALPTNDDERLSRILDYSQSVHSTLSHLLDFVISPAPLAISPEKHTTTLPSRAYRIFPASLWKHSFQTLPANVVWQLIRWASPPCLINVPNSAPDPTADLMTDGGGVGEPPSVGLKEPAMLWFTRSTAAEIEDFLAFAQNRRPKGLTTEGLLSYWLLQTGDLKHPTEEYKHFTRSSEKLAAQLGSVSAEGRSKRKLSDYQEALQREDKLKGASTAAVQKWFIANSQTFIRDDEGTAVERTIAVIAQLVIPRSSWSVADALFSYQWLTLMVEAGTLDVVLVTISLISLCLPAIFGATDIEADSLGLLCSTWLNSLPEQLVKTGAGPASEVGQSEAGSNNVTRLLLNVELLLVETLERVTPTWYTSRRILRLLNQICSTLPVSRNGYERVMARIQTIENTLPDNREITSVTKSLRRRLTQRKVRYCQELIFPT